MFKKNNKTRAEILQRKIEKRVNNQSRFFKHGSIYLLLFCFFIIFSIFIRDSGFFMGFGIVFMLWAIGLSFHFLSAFVFNKIDSWNETKYQKELNKLQLAEPLGSIPEDNYEEDWIEEELDLKSPIELKSKSPSSPYADGDFV